MHGVTHRVGSRPDDITGRLANAFARAAHALGDIITELIGHVLYPPSGASRPVLEAGPRFPSARRRQQQRRARSDREPQQEHPDAGIAVPLDDHYPIVVIIITSHVYLPRKRHAEPISTG